MSPQTIAKYIDHTLLKPDATSTQIENLCQEAIHFGVMAVCVNPSNVALAAQYLQGTQVKLCSVIGFPLGATLAAVKGFEATQVLKQGAAEIDMVLNIGAIKSGDTALARADIAQVVQIAHQHQALCKVIIEAALLTEAEKITTCHLVQDAGADFVKTSTGFQGGATAEDVALIKRTVGPTMGIKAAGGIKTWSQAQAMITAGATRLGTSSGIEIIKQARG